MRVAAVQFRPTKGDKASSLAHLVRLATAAARGAHLVVLPEMAATGYVFPGPEAVRPLAETPDGPTFQALSRVAADAGAWVVAGLPERDGERLYNSALVISPSGSLEFTYRKTLLFQLDTTWASPGDSGYRYFATDAGTFGVGICMDLNDDRFIAWCRGSSLRAIAFPTNWVAQGVPVWPYWAWRLVGVDAALVAANTWGQDGEVAFAGRSAVVRGRDVLAAAAATGDGIIRAELRAPERVSSNSSRARAPGVQASPAPGARRD